jgi:O-antigen ligase
MPLGHPNTASGVLLLLLPIAFIRGIESRSFPRTLIFLGASFLILGGILFSLSRSTLVIAIPILMACMIYFVRARKKWTILVLAVWLVAGAAGVIFLAARYDFSRFWSRSYYENASVSRRAQTMMTAVHVFRDYPLLGVSPGSVYRRDDLDPNWVPDHVDAMGEILFYKEDVTSRHAHNVYLHALAEYGGLGGGAFFLLMLYLTKSLWRAYTATRNSATGGHGNITAYGLSLVSFLGLGLMAVFFLYNLRVGVVFWTLFGLALHYCGLVLNERALEPANGSR